ncbi:hydroxyacid dehydrogenase [Microbacterium xanthum]|uniref:hydroxyacid dehydrogenase n=1 Tax=Microbacterium xanthum TaxID=3079794 RepID=UPI002AD36A4F|nr:MULTISPECIES: hydroxyacid dehydrogenase [unclassified Microbacterium]MDZ8173012.1 hydroxyacid dehydrogenase [Microbacterium sp. KSW-48]MDZ8200830.1 hydroxyacid dehydrogenase [Microbacterium sp. SSW1-59]
MSRPRAMFAAGSPQLFSDLFDEVTLSRLGRVVDLDSSVATRENAWNAATSREVEVLITGWGAPRFDHAMLQHWPRLRAIVHAAGSVKRLVTPEMWDRGIRVASAAQANAYPVAEYTLAMILLSSKRILDSARTFSHTEDWQSARPLGSFGGFGSVIGIVGASRVGRRVIELLQPFDMSCLLYDPSVSNDECRRLGATPASLEDLMRRADIVSLHAPALPETHHMIGRAELALLRDDGVLINTARGTLVDTDALVDEIRPGRLRAILDVTDPEPLPPGHALFGLSGVTLTPHVAGSLGNELRRMGVHVTAEVERFVLSGNFLDEVTAPDLATIA